MNPIMQFFRSAHLPEHLAAVARPFESLAKTVSDLPENPEREAALRHLLEAKDAAVRARLYVSPVAELFADELGFQVGSRVGARLAPNKEG